MQQTIKSLQTIEDPQQRENALAKLKPLQDFLENRFSSQNSGNNVFPFLLFLLFSQNSATEFLDFDFPRKLSIFIGRTKSWESGNPGISHLT